MIFSHTAALPDPKKTPSLGRILLFSYAFPPMQVQMTPAVFKPMAALVRMGYDVDVVCADAFCNILPLDNSLLPATETLFPNITRLNPPPRLIGKHYSFYRTLSPITDLMGVLHKTAYRYLMDSDLQAYDAVMTWSPFHSINPVMVKLKKHRPNIRWLAQFGDPWAGNPLERRFPDMKNRLHQPRMVKAADFIVHSSAYSLDLMMRGYGADMRAKTTTIPHAFSEDLYPARPKAKNEKITLRYVGVLYGRRSPESMFVALNQLLARRAELKDRLVIEFIGQVDDAMFQTPAALALPEGMLQRVANVDYLTSLQLMYDADILLLIEANVRQNLFLASKISDYMGTNNPMVGIVPPGASADIMTALCDWYASPLDCVGIARALEGAIDHVLQGSTAEWCNKEVRDGFNDKNIAQKFSSIIQTGSSPVV